MTVKRKQKDAPRSIGDRLLTLREAAEVLHLNPRTVAGRAESGDVPHFVPPRKNHRT